MKKSLFDIVENELNTTEVVKSIQKSLEMKYNQHFHIKRIGNRFGAGTFNEATAICSPTNNKDMLFTVIFDMINNQILDDDFIIRNVCFELEDELHDAFKKSKIEIFSRVEIIGKNSLDKIYSIQEFSNEFVKSNFLATIIVKGNIPESKLNDIFLSINEKYGKIYLNTLIYILDSKDFDNCHKGLKNLPVFSTALIEQYHINNMYKIQIFNGEIIKK